MKNSRNIIVAGGGIAGLTAALCLANTGFRAIVLERSGGTEPIGAGLQLSPNALAILQKLGLESRIRAVSAVPEAIRLISAYHGTEIGRVPLGATALDRYGLPYLVAHRADLCEVLAGACDEHPGIELHFGHKVVDAVSHANGITVMSYCNEAMHEYSGKALIAADGVWSKLRTEYVGARPPAYSGMVAWRALIPSERVATDKLRNTELWLAPSAHGVTYEVRDGKYLNVVVITTDQTPEMKWDIAADIGSLQNTLSDWHRDFGQLLETQAKWTKWPLFEAPVPKRWAVDKVALIGDAAHAMLPFAAQGAAMAIEDAWVLAENLTATEELATALSGYELARRKRVKRAVHLARTNRTIYHLAEPLASCRNLVIRHMPEKMLLTRQDWLYGWQP